MSYEKPNPLKLEKYQNKLLKRVCDIVDCIDEIQFKEDIKPSIMLKAIVSTEFVTDEIIVDWIETMNTDYTRYALSVTKEDELNKYYPSLQDYFDEKGVKIDK